MENKVQLNGVFKYDFEFTQKDVINFAEATGDKNPIHLDEEYAKNFLFKKRILHGFLGGSVFSKVFGTIFPGEGTIYLKQSMTFHKPMFVNEKYTAVFKIIKIFSEKKRALVETNIKNLKDEIITSGEALISHSSIK